MYDAIIVGARCAGSPTAMLLAQKGYRVLLVDRDKYPRGLDFDRYFRTRIVAGWTKKLRRPIKQGLNTAEYRRVGDCSVTQCMMAAQAQNR